MNNKAHTILVSIIASYGSRLTVSTANCKAFLADFLAEYPEERDVLVELHLLQLTTALTALKNNSIDKKTFIEFIEQLETRTNITKHNLAWGVDAWANTLDLDVKTRRMIRKQCFANATRELHIVTIRAAETITEAAPEVPDVVVKNANQAALPRMAIMGVATLVSTFSIFQAVKSMLPTDSAPAAPTIEQAAAPEVSAKTPLPKLVVIPSRQTEEAFSEPTNQLSQNLIDVEKLTNNQISETPSTDETEVTIEFAAADTTNALAETTDVQAVKDDLLHADIEAFLTQSQ